MIASKERGAVPYLVIRVLTAALKLGDSMLVILRLGMEVRLAHAADTTSSRRQRRVEAFID
jgi:hypothetical protein